MNNKTNVANLPPAGRKKIWKKTLLLAGVSSILVAALAGGWVVDRMALSFLTGQRRVPGQDWFGHPVRPDGPIPGYAFLGYSETNRDPAGFRLTRVADEGLQIGLQAGDVVCRVDGKTSGSSFEVITALLAQHQAGERVRVEYRRGSEDRVADVELRPFLRSPADLGLEFETIELASTSGSHLRGWYIPAAEGSPRKVLIFVHGAKASRFQALDSLQDWHRRGYSVLAMDLSGRGESSGKYVTYTQLERQDVRSMVNWLVEERDVSPSRIALFGTSNGAASVIFAAAEIPQVGAVILDAPYSDLWQEAREMLQSRGVPPFLAHVLGWAVWWRAGVDISGIRPLEVIERIQTPTLLVHGEADSQVLPYHSERLHRRRVDRGLPARLWKIPGGEHGFDNYPADFWQKIADFADQALKREGDLYTFSREKSPGS